MDLRPEDEGRLHKSLTVMAKLHHSIVYILIVICLLLTILSIESFREAPVSVIPFIYYRLAPILITAISGFCCVCGTFSLKKCGVASRGLVM